LFCFVVGTTKTDSNGNYDFAGLPPGNYVVKESKPLGYSINVSDQDNSIDGDKGDSNKTADNLITVTLTDGEEDKDNDFVDDRTPTASPTRSPTIAPTPPPTPPPSKKPTRAPTPPLPTPPQTPPPTKKPTRPPTPPLTAGPTKSPTPPPTPKPTIASTPAPTKSPEVCDSVTVDFDKAADGTLIKRGYYVRDQWKSLGLTLLAEGGLSKSKGNMPRIFDTNNPGTENAGDPDLGAPNERCTPAGPGTGKGGGPGNKGVNCAPQGNALIVQEVNNRPDVPDDAADGGTIPLDFPDAGGKFVSEIGLLDIDEPTSVVVIYENEVGAHIEKVIAVPILGDNSFQVVKIDTERVRWIKVMMEKSGAVTYIKFCP
jgi:hypothetical protein